MAGRRRGSRRSAGGGWLLGLFVLLLACLVAVFWVLVLGHGPRTARSTAGGTDFGERVRALAGRRGAEAPDIQADSPIRKVDGVFVRSWRVTLPDREAAAGLLADLEAETAAWQGSFATLKARPPAVATARIALGVERLEVELRVRAVPATATPEPSPTPSPSPSPRPTPRPGTRGRLAILLDDGGQDMALVPAAAALPRAVAVSVLPFLPHSGDVAAAMHRADHEVWLHLPMEPEDGSDSGPGPGAVTVRMSEEEIRSTVHAALNNVPHVVGVNNHMGSKATADLRTMTWVMQELSARGMAFIDSRTTIRTVAEDAARAQGVKTGRRHLFLDNERTRPAVRRQLAEAIYRSRTEGPIVAIGHMVPVTVEVLEEELPGVAERGVDLVPPSKLVR